MSAIYYTIVYRPKGSHMWTPWYWEFEGGAQTWLSNPDTVRNQVVALNAYGFTRSMQGTGETVTLEFRAARVEVEE